MSDLGIKVGDKIRVTYVHEGVVDEITVTEGISYGDGDYYFHPEEANERGVTIEILERAKPTYKPGTLAWWRTRKGEYAESYVRTNDGVWMAQSGGTVGDEVIEDCIRRGGSLEVVFEP